MNTNKTRSLLAAAMLLLGTVTNAQIVVTTAGSTSSTALGDGGPATEAGLSAPGGIATDAAGNVYICDYNNQRIRKVNAAGIISSVAGNGSFGFSGDGGPATAAVFNGVQDIALDGAGNMYIVDNVNQRLRKVDASGIITTIAGTGTATFSGDGGPASAAMLNNPTGVTLDAAGNIYIADAGNHRIRKINASGIITTVAGSSSGGAFLGDGGPATAAELNYPEKVIFDASGRMLIADGGNRRVRRVDAAGVITTIAGSGSGAYAGDGGPATAAGINTMCGIELDAAGNLYIADRYNNRIRKVNTSGIISTYAGGGSLTTEGCAASSAMISPFYLAVRGTNVYFSDDIKVRMVDTSNTAPITGTAALCTGATTTLGDVTPSGTWSSSAPAVATVGVTTGVVTGLTAGTAIITYAITGSAASRVVTVSAAPSVTASAASACGGIHILTSGGALTYSWSPATGLSCAACAITNANPTVTTVYTVTGSSTTGCTATATVPVNGNRISGFISPAPAGSIRVWLVHFNPADSTIIATDSMIACTTTGGIPYYEFASPAAGEYLVKAYLLGGTTGASGYIPTYGDSTAYWYTGAAVTHTSATDTQHVYMLYGTVPSGPGFISGDVVSGAGKGTSGNIPVSNMLIYLKNAAGKVLTYTYTNSAGAYSFTGLAYGTYYIYPEAYKYYTTQSALITLSAATPSKTAVHFKQHTTMGTITPYSATNVLPAAAAALSGAYPNPCSTELAIDNVTGSTSYCLRTIAGARVLSGTLNASNNTIATKDIASGIYLLELTNENGERSIIKIVKE